MIRTFGRIKITNSFRAITSLGYKGRLVLVYWSFSL